MAWSVALLTVSHAPLFHSLASDALPRSPEFTFQSLANTSWAYAASSLISQPLLEALAAAARRKLALSWYIEEMRCSEEAIRGIGWAIARGMLPRAGLVATLRKSLHRMAAARDLKGQRRHVGNQSLNSKSAHLVVPGDIY